MVTLRTLFGGNKTASALLEQIIEVPFGNNILITKLPYEVFKGFRELGYHLAEHQRSGFVHSYEKNNTKMVYVHSCQAAYILSDDHLSDLSVAITSAGVADRDVVDEAALTVALNGFTPKLFDDVGVNDLDKLMATIPQIKDSSAVVSVQGFEGALPVILAGLVDMPIIAVPTSTGYGVSNDGVTSLNTALTSCTSGISAVNINNGFGGATVAVRILRQVEKYLGGFGQCF